MAYEVTEKGRRHFEVLMQRCLAAPYRPEFDLDAALALGGAVDKDVLLAALSAHEQRVARQLAALQERRRQLSPAAAGGRQTMRQAVLGHRLAHCRAELRRVRALRLPPAGRGPDID